MEFFGLEREKQRLRRKCLAAFILPILSSCHLVFDFYLFHFEFEQRLAYPRTCPRKNKAIRKNRRLRQDGRMYRMRSKKIVRF